MCASALTFICDLYFRSNIKEIRHFSFSTLKGNGALIKIVDYILLIKLIVFKNSVSVN